MHDIFTLYQYVITKYHNYQAIKCTEKEIIIVFHDEFEMKIQLQGLYDIFFNNYFYYSVDWQDIKDTVDDFLTNKYVFYIQNNKLKIKDYRENIKCNHAWTIEKTLK